MIRARLLASALLLLLGGCVAYPAYDGSGYPAAYPYAYDGGPYYYGSVPYGYYPSAWPYYYGPGWPYFSVYYGGYYGGGYHHYYYGGRPGWHGGHASHGGMHGH